MSALYISVLSELEWIPISLTSRAFLQPCHRCKQASRGSSPPELLRVPGERTRMRRQPRNKQGMLNSERGSPQLPARASAPPWKPLDWGPGDRAGAEPESHEKEASEPWPSGWGRRRGPPPVLGARFPA